jgi:hypothetical protein
MNGRNEMMVFDFPAGSRERYAFIAIEPGNSSRFPTGFES